MRILAISIAVMNSLSRSAAFQFASHQSPTTGTSALLIRHSSSSFSTTTSLFLSNLSYETRQKCWRPTVQDVESISWGKPAKKKGTGSRGVPHRLNEDERLLFDQARRKGFLEIAGSGWRSQRGDAPLVNSYRSLCDARGQVCITLHKGNTGLDELVVDISPLRLPDTFQLLEDDMVEFVGLKTSYKASEENEDTDESEVDIVDAIEAKDGESPWNSRPIYQLPTYCISWEIQRSEGKQLGKKLAKEFDTIEKKGTQSKKPKHLKPGKNRKNGGYGIG
eukprot:scaffold107_cov269-Chaetoceros_neogracile.AAC.41